MAIKKEQGLNEGIDGILGLGPNHENGPSYLLALKYKNKINKAIVSFSLGYNNGEVLKQNSYMIFGGINSTQIHGDLKEFKLVNNKWWALKFTEFRYSSTIFEREKEGISIQFDPSNLKSSFSYS
jgi:hypothetical protein